MASSNHIKVQELSDGSVVVKTKDGTEYGMKEPRVKAFMELESWTNSDDPLVKTQLGVAMKVISLCIHQKNGEPYKVTDFDQFCDDISVEDVEVLGAGLASFQSVFEYLNDKATNI
jgi:hypothetical protein